MSEPAKKAPSPEERPDLYDDYDGRPHVTDEQRAKESAYFDSILSDHLKEALAEKKDNS